MAQAKDVIGNNYIVVSGQNPPGQNPPPPLFNSPPPPPPPPPVYLANRTESPLPSQTESTSILEQSFRYYMYLVDNKWWYEKIKYDNLVIFYTYFYLYFVNSSIIEVCFISLLLLAVIVAY